MILRCAACMSSGSACAIAFSAASRSPLLMASSTDRTAPRIWGRRDLLMMVRRAILRVALLAAVILSIFLNLLCGGPRLFDDGAAGNLARRLFGGSSIGHVLKCPSTVTDRDLS